MNEYLIFLQLVATMVTGIIGGILSFLIKLFLNHLKTLGKRIDGTNERIDSLTKRIDKLYEILFSHSRPKGEV